MLYIILKLIETIAVTTIITGTGMLIEKHIDSRPKTNYKR